MRNGQVTSLNEANAYFTGAGRTTRVLLFDTLIERLEPAKFEAVMAHELGHYRCGHLHSYCGLLGGLLYADTGAVHRMYLAGGRLDAASVRMVPPTPSATSPL